MTSMVIRTEIVLVDKSGNPIDSAYLTLDNMSVTVTVPVTMEKTIPLVCSYLPGVSSSAYESVYVSHNSIKVKGDPKVLNEIDSFIVFALDGKAVDTEIDFSTVLIPGSVEVLNAPSTVKIVAELTEIVPESTTESGQDTEENNN